MNIAEKRESFQIEFVFLNPDIVEVKLYDNITDKSYRSWKMTVTVAGCIASWWQEQISGKTPEKRFRDAVIITHSTNFVDVKELDTLGQPKPIGWSLPIVVVDALVKEMFDN